MYHYSKVVLGDLFIDFWEKTPAMKEYTAFLTNCGSAQAYLFELTDKFPNLRTFLQEAAKGEARGLSLSAFLMQPVQRLPRYMMMLSDTLEALQEGDVDYANIEKSIVKTKQALDTLEETQTKAASMRKIEEFKEKLVDIPKGFVLHGLQECLHDGILVEEKLFGSQHIYMCLFPDILMCTMPKKQTFVIKSIISLNELVVIQRPMNKDTGQIYLLFRWSNQKKEMSLCVSSAQGTEWLLKIQAAQKKL